MYRQLFLELTEEKMYGWFQQDSATTNTAHSMLPLMSLETELSSVVFGQHHHPTLNPCDFSLLVLSEG
jgi:hypothetical protein